MLRRSQISTPLWLLGLAALLFLLGPVLHWTLRRWLSPNYWSRGSG